MTKRSFQNYFKQTRIEKKDFTIDVVFENVTPMEEETPRVENIPELEQNRLKTNDMEAANNDFEEEILKLINKARSDPEWLLNLLSSKEITRIGKGINSSESRNRSVMDVRPLTASGGKPEVMLDQKCLREAITFIRR